jgi:hypothetical protein
MATNTYVAIETQTVTSTVASVTLGSGGTIPQTYTDLVLVVSGKSTSGIVNWGLRFNGDTGSNYSRTLMFGNGSTGGGSRQTSSTSANPGFLTTAGSPTIIQIMNYRNTTTYKSWIARAGDASDSVSASVGLWRGSTGSATNQPITSITLFSDGSTSIAEGTTFTLYGIENSNIGAPKAFGGTITQDATHTYHTFGASGTFTPQQSLTCDYLVVAGGGGASAFGSGGGTGGGGAGGLRSSIVATGGGGSLESAINVTAQNYTITVGAGGTFVNNGNANPGTDSTFSTITSTGGGRGAYDGNGGNGGSGGGGYGYPAGSFTGGTRVTGQGFAGGVGSTDGSTWTASAGGGGAGAVGATTTSDGDGGAGGIGVSIPIVANVTGTGVATYYAGGGGGGTTRPAWSGGAGGLGGGGRGGSQGQAGINAIANTGGGGGGAGGASSAVAGNGGSGVVIIRYAN